jgi:hypothetical protein
MTASAHDSVTALSIPVVAAPGSDVKQTDGGEDVGARRQSAVGDNQTLRRRNGDVSDGRSTAATNMQ